MTKRQKTDLNAQMIWLGDENDSNPLARVLKFLKCWGVRLPYQFAFVDSSEDFLTSDLTWKKFVDKYQDATEYYLKSLLAASSEVSKFMQDQEACSKQKKTLLRLVCALTEADQRFVILSTSGIELPYEVREQTLAFMSEVLRSSERTFFIHSLEESNWAQGCDYKMQLCPRQAFSLERHISPLTQMGQELGSRFHIVHSPESVTPMAPVTSEKEMDDKVQHLKKFG